MNQQFHPLNQKGVSWE
jgi:hypothetical protein